jgi:hypothetical protein
MLNVTFEGESIREAINKLQQVDPDLKKMLMKDLRTSIKPIASAVAAAVPSEGNPPLSGMKSGYARLRWGGVKGSVSVTPGKKRGDTRLVSLVVTGSPDAGFKMAELAGSRSNGFTPQGENMIKVLRQRFPTPGSGKGGRFAFTKFREEKPEVVRLAVDLINKHLDDVNRKF